MVDDLPCQNIAVWIKWVKSRYRFSNPFTSIHASFHSFYFLHVPYSLSVSLSVIISTTHTLSISPPIYSSSRLILFLFLFCFLLPNFLLLLVHLLFFLILILFLFLFSALSLSLSVHLSQSLFFQFLFLLIFPGELMNGSACIRDQRPFPLSHPCSFIMRRCTLQVCTITIPFY